ncbi:hypothetical protein [Maridesulfovibrio sp.]|uniref:hypothetical protein n=1 Tax=Maridesulfovibrio sp. TaxID=2795000 RepID=UPI003BA9A614
MNNNQQLPATTIINETLKIICECFTGASQNGAFLEPGPTGLLDLLRSLSSENASTPAAGTSVATHALHVEFALNAFIEWINGERDIEYDWNKSWAKSEVTEKEWQELIQKLDEGFKQLKEAITHKSAYDQKAAWGAAGVLAHTAYHLGAIQVKVDVLRE